MPRDSVEKRRRWPFKGPNDACHISYKRFKTWIIQRSSSESPTASSPLTPGWQSDLSFELDTVCQRLELDSPPRLHQPAQSVLHGNIQETVLAGGESQCGAVTNTPSNFTEKPSQQEVKELVPALLELDQAGLRLLVPRASPASILPGLVWSERLHEYGAAWQRSTGSEEEIHALQPFAVLDKSSLSQQRTSVIKLAAPALLNDYYTDLLDCSCNGVVALALGSSVYLWNSETRTLVGHLCPKPQSGHSYHQTISCLSWSRDGRALCVGTRRGEIQMWDVEHKNNMRCLPSHLSVVRALSWKQQLLSSGSVLGRIHHLDPRVPTPLVGAALQGEGLCSLQWSPGGDRLASGSTEGRLCIWDSDIAGVKWSRQPITTMKQPSAVKAMGWCPWQRKTMATGGGWKDGELRIWDTDSGTCVTSVNTKSQICSLRWAEKKKYLVTGHGRPHHQVTCWSWDFPSLSSHFHITGHSHRVLHLATNPNSTQVFSAGADQQFHISDL